ncbi:MAG: VWA domain-containing protein [Thermaurantimonas sp.]|uniref:VWA domain-containing protein n=1 Tax=Thermaurantimonas sp. TaxID=2681568 RepID=UPI003918AAE5
MEKKTHVHNLIILDESGSMSSIKSLIISGFNELIQSIKETQRVKSELEHTISFFSFNSNGIKEHYFMVTVDDTIQEINSSNYNPHSMTPLYDAMGFSITKLRNALENHDNYEVLVTILTDGLENHSTEYTADAIKKLVEELKAKGWTFTYIGTDHDVYSQAHNIAVTNILFFNKTEMNIKEMFEKEKKSRQRYYYKIMENKKENMNKDFNDKFYEDEDIPKENN